jgi:hypothetical protein
LLIIVSKRDCGEVSDPAEGVGNNVRAYWRLEKGKSEFAEFAEATEMVEIERWFFAEGRRNALSPDDHMPPPGSALPGKRLETPLPFLLGLSVESDGHGNPSHTGAEGFRGQFQYVERGIWPDVVGGESGFGEHAARQDGGEGIGVADGRAANGHGGTGVGFGEEALEDSGGLEANINGAVFDEDAPNIVFPELSDGGQCRGNSLVGQTGEALPGEELAEK